jgi:hypothetical protein
VGACVGEEVKRQFCEGGANALFVMSIVILKSCFHGLRHLAATVGEVDWR